MHPHCAYSLEDVPWAPSGSDNMNKLRISDELSLPLDYVTQTGGILAVRGAGKSNTAAAIAEEMFAAKLPFVVIDPVGSWYGLRSTADGTGAGLSIPIFGGRHGDVPLERGAGQMIADMVVDRRMTCVLDVSEFSEGDKIRFLIDFAERLYRRNTEPLHLFLEEADDFIPQRPMREQARLLGAWENIVRRGRSRGLGMTMITQRSAAINKNVLTQIETLFVMRTTSPQDNAAIEGWVKYQGGRHDMLATLPNLESGEAWVWSPAWLKIFKRVRIRRRSTFDSGATPKHVTGKRAITTLADVDLNAVRKQMADTIERAEASDPKKLQALVAAKNKRIADLERELEKVKTAKPAGCEKRIDVPVIGDKDVATLERATERVNKALGQAAAVADNMRAAVDVLNEATKRARTPTPVHAASFTLGKSVTLRPTSATVSRAAVAPRRPTNGHGALADLPKGERLMVVAAAQHPDGVTREQLTLLTGYKRSTRDAYVQRAAEKGLLDVRGDSIHATDHALTALGGDFDPLPTGAALREHYLRPGNLPEGERRILEIVCAGITNRDAIGEATGFKRSTRDAYLQRLGVRKLVIAGSHGEARPSAHLFD
jgi:hypothetical protein